MRLLALIGVFVWLTVAPALAVNPDEVLSDPVLEARARTISEGIRCLVCQNESIDDSNADLARELRLLVRERLVAGDTDEQAVQFLVDRYGEYVLLRPVVAAHTLLLWAAAPTVLVGGGLVVLFASRRRKVAGEAPALTAEEQRVLDELDSSRR